MVGKLQTGHCNFIRISYGCYSILMELTLCREPWTMSVKSFVKCYVW